MLFEFGGFFRKVWRVALFLGTFVIGANSLFVAPVSAATGINQQLNFQGRLLNAQGAIVVDGYYNVEFKIYQDGTGIAAGNPGGTLKWTEVWLNANSQGVRVVNGYISVQLGSINAFGSSIDWNQDTLWLSVNIGSTNASCTPFASCSGDGEMLPMKRLSSVPYALNAGQLGGLTAAGFIQNTTTVQAATNLAIGGSARVDTSILTPSIDTNTAVALNIGTTNATSINLNQNVTVAANKTLTLAGGTTLNRPASPVEGTMWYDTDTKQLLVYSNGKWQSDSKAASFIVAASNSSQTDKDGAQYVTDGENSSGSGTGTIDGDQVQINQAIDAAAATGGGTVYLLPGTYTIDAPIAVRNNITLAGAGATTIVQLGNFGASSVDIQLVTNYDQSTGTGIVVRDMVLDGRSSLNTVGWHVGVYLTNMGASGALARDGAKVTGLTVRNIHNEAIHLTGSSTGNTISNNTIRNAYRGIALNTSTKHNSISNNIIQNNTESGMFISGNASYNTITSNTLSNNASYGIYLSSTTNTTIADNTLYDNGGSGNNNGLYFASGASNNTVTGNTIDDSAATTNNAVYISTGANVNYLADNSLGNGAVSDAGTGTVYANQSRSANGGQLTNRTANDTQAFAVQNAAGSNIFAVDTTNNQVVIGNTTTVGTINLSDGSSNTLTVSVASLAGDYTLSIPTITANDTVCLQSLANCGSSLTVGALDGGTANANGMTISGPNVYLQSASASYAGLVNTGTQTFAGAKTFNDSLTLAAGKTLTLLGDTRANITANITSPTEGMMIYDTSNKQLLVYSNGKWQADRTSATLVAANDSTQAAKDAADFVGDGNTATANDGDQVQIAQAIADANPAGTGRKTGKVYLFPGTYTIDAGISLPNNITFAGAGASTIITIPNSFNTDINVIANTTTGGNGSGIVIQDLRLEGNRTNQTSGNMYGIYFNGVGSNSTAGSAVQGGRITNVWSNNWRSNGIFFISSNSSTITNSTTQNNASINILINNSNYITISNSVSVAGTYGIYQNGTSSHNNFSTNTVLGAVAAGVYLGASSSNTIVANNKIHDNGGAANNNGIYLVDSDSNTITGNAITDSAATANYSLNITDAASSSNYLANNTLGTGSINDSGTGTIYAGQYFSATSFLLQPATNMTLGNSSTTTTIQGSLSITPQTSTSTTLLCNGAGGIVSTCDSSVLAPSATNFIRNQNAAQQATANFWISGSARSDTSILTPTIDTATGVVLNIGTTTATGITLGKSGVATTTAGGLLSTTVDATSGNALSLGATNATSVNIGKSAIATSLNSSTINVGTSGATTTILGASQTTNNNAGNAMVIQGSTGLNGNGGTVTVQGGNANGTGTLGGNLTLAGGTGSASNGTVILATSTFQTATTDASCFPSGAESTSTSNCTIAQNSVNNNASVLVGFTNDGQTAFMPDPSILTAGRVVYVTASGATKDFTLSVNGGGQGNQIAMRKNTTATMIWNGADWTAAGASSSTTLQAAYDNTLQSAGGAELVVSKTTATNGLTIRDSATNSVNGTLLSIQTKTASTLLSVNSNVTDYATNGGAETAFASDWALIPSSGATVSRNTTTGNIAVGTGSVSITTATSANSGARNTLTAALTPGLRYNVSFTAKLNSGNFVDLNVNYSNDGTTANTPCANYSTQAVATSVWTKVNCTFTAPASTSASNAIFIRQTASGTARTFYVDNLSITIGADQSYATDGDVNDAGNFSSNWQAVTGGGTVVATRDTDYGYRASDSAKAAISTVTAGAGIKNKLSINPLATTPGTLYRITAYASSTTAMTDFTIRYSRDNGTNFDSCVDYNTQTLSGNPSDFKKITCYVTVSSTAASNAWVFFTQGAGAARSIYVDSFSMTIASNTTPNVQVGGGVNGGPTTLFTLDKGASAPIANDNDTLLGSMYYDTTLGKLQCYEADGWGACGSSPDTVVTISPEYNNAVLHGPGVGTMTSDICSDTLNINDATNGPVICGTNETYNFYKWTSPQASPQTYSIYVTYQLPSTFKEFASGQTSLMGRTDSANSAVSYRIFRSDENGLTPCSATVSVSTGIKTSWQTKIASGAADPSTCGFEPGDSVVFQIDMVASTTANAYVSNLNFTFSNR